MDVTDAAAVERGCADADLVVSVVDDPSHTVENGLVVTDLGLGPGVNALNSLGLISKVSLSFLTLGLEKRAASTVAKPQAHLLGKGNSR